MHVCLTVTLIAVLLAGCGQRPSGQSVARPAPPPRILQVGLVLDSPAPDAIQMPFARGGTHGGNTNSTLTVRIVPGLDEASLEKEQRICAFGFNLGVEVQFAGNARQQWTDFTRTNTGRTLAVILDGKVWQTTKISAESSDGWLVIPGDWTLPEAQAFCRRLNPPTNSGKTQ